MKYRKSMSRSGSNKNFKRNLASKKINHVQARGMRGGIRL